ncbi:MAG: NAD-dependent epimerase/dehydratase family protein [Kiritimatiellia bacterium]|jgi:CDP-paratose 2-epimerase|nr:NAD-dependent epimerase/dehydratase family protein [Kiritimatiellia bacterium]MDP7024481.1 NAD-dependent epimerase/dehydratase family protein [Kiritimatiellia bacterium]
MSVVIVSGAAGLIGSETARFFAGKGLDVVGVDNDMRAEFFGAEASTAWNRQRLEADLKSYTHVDEDIRDANAMNGLFERYAGDVMAVIHTAAQPSHDWAARDPIKDFTVNANGTLVLLESTRKHCSDAVFVFTSTNKVYGDVPNSLPLVEQEMRWELDPTHHYAEHGIDETMSIDQCKHSLFGASKVAADVLVQEYGRYFGMKTGVFRGGCLTGPAHSGTELHGFLAYLAKCCVSGAPYTVFGYKGKQVRDNIHSYDLVNMFWHFVQNPRVGEVYNAGGSRHSNCSMLEGIALCEELSGRKMNYTYVDDNRIGDHMWWISDVRKFQSHYPEWGYRYGLQEIVQEIVAAIQERSV